MPGFPVVIVAKGGIPVRNTPKGAPAQVASNGRGKPITLSSCGVPLNVAGAPA